MEKVVGIIILFLILGLCSGIIFLKLKHRIKLLPLLIVLFCCALLTIVILNVFFYNSEKEVAIHTTTSDNSEEFVLKINNHKLKYESVYTQFSTSSTLEDLMELIKKTYPNDRVSINKREVSVVHNNNVLLLKEIGKKNFLWQNRNIFTLNSECIDVEISKNKFVCIPFPEEYLETDSGYSNVMSIKCDMAELKKFYEGFSNVEFSTDSIVINLDKSVKLTIDNGKIAFKIA